MAGVDRLAPRAFLAAGYAPDDWVGVLLKSYRTGQAIQRVVPVSTVASEPFLAWLRAMNARRFEVYVSTNAVAAAQGSRARQHVATVRHVIVDSDTNGARLLAKLSERSDLPPPSCVLRTSPGRLHVLWRVEGLDVPRVEAVQRHLARELSTDTAATSAAQMTRLPGFFNHKRGSPFPVSLLLGRVSCLLRSADFPAVHSLRRTLAQLPVRTGQSGALARVRAYLRSVPPAVAGERGDAHTFRVCCRVVRGFALDDAEALTALAEWNERCAPPWSVEELASKVRNAKLYGRELVGGLIAANRLP